MKNITKALLIAASCIPLLASANSSTTKPNVLLIIADDMGIDASHCYSLGENQAKMPNVEKLCSNGMVFEKAYSGPVCSPTRSTIMTGKYGFRTGVGAAIPKNGGTNGLADDETSLFDVLSTTNYKANKSAVVSRANWGHTMDQ